MAKLDPAILSRAAEALMAGNVSEAIFAYKSDINKPFYENEERDARTLELILTRTPQALADCPPQYLPPLRVAAALMSLFGLGASSIRKFISVEDDYNYRFEPEAVGLMLYAYGYHLESLSQMATSGITKVMVSGSGNPDECAVCREANGKVFPIAEAPEVPLPDCACPRACSCIVIAVS